MTAQKPLAQKNHIPLPRENHAYEPSLENTPLMITYLGRFNAPLFARQNITKPSPALPMPGALRDLMTQMTNRDLITLVIIRLLRILMLALRPKRIRCVKL